MPRPSWRRYTRTPLPGIGDHRHRLVQLRLAVAALRAEDVPGEAFAVHPHQDGLVAAHVAPDQRDVGDVGDHVLVRVRDDGAVLGRQRGGRAALDEPLVAPPVGDDVVDGHDLDVVLGGEHVEVGAPGHAAVVRASPRR